MKVLAKTASNLEITGRLFGSRAKQAYVFGVVVSVVEEISLEKKKNQKIVVK